RVYVAHADSALSTLDARTLALQATVKLPGPPEAFQLDRAHSRLFINTLRPSRVAVIDTARNTVTATFPLTSAEANYPLALDAERQRVFVGCRKPPKVIVLDARSGNEVAGADIPGDVDDLAYDAKRRRLYASCGDGFLAVLQEDEAGRLRPLAQLATAKLART